MSSIQEQNRQELAALWATINTLGQLNGNKAKGVHLFECFTKQPFLIKYFRCAYDAHRTYGFTWQECHEDTNEFAGDFHPMLVSNFLKRLSEGEFDDTEGYARAYWKNIVGTLPKELRQVANRILHKDLQCGLAPQVLNKVLVKLEKDPVAIAPPPEATDGLPDPTPPGKARDMEFVVYDDEAGHNAYVLAKLYLNDFPVVDCCFLKTCAREAFAMFRAKGFKFSALKPPYLNKP